MTERAFVATAVTMKMKSKRECKEQLSGRTVTGALQRSEHASPRSGLKLNEESGVSFNDSKTASSCSSTGDEADSGASWIPNTPSKPQSKVCVIADDVEMADKLVDTVFPTPLQESNGSA
ncbi:hypothetical protein RJ639_018189 [Escallonia herrerae]|uniref:Uncharacterized protein n=1 Tax=Escallonia herrerae TaxID=1293975 RepID=A0AA88V7B9_9ASTE|nr:hypothetical protein RJ639_018189 [Escallonia herrerae]